MHKEVLIFTTSTCLPCKQLKAQLAGIPKISNNIRYLCMDDPNNNEAQERAILYGVHSAPTLIFMIGGVPQTSTEGYSQRVIRQVQDFLLTELQND